MQQDKQGARVGAQGARGRGRVDAGLRPGLLALLISAGWAAMAVPVAAQTQQPAVQAQRIGFDLPAQPLMAALRAFGKQTDYQVLYDEAQVAGLRSPAVKGSFTPKEAIDRLLVGTGLAADSTSPGSFTLRKLPQPPVAVGDNTLAPVVVTAQAERSGNTEGTGSYTTGVTSAATRMNLSIKETPQSISVITRQRMDDQALTNTVQALEQTAGIVIHHDDGERYNIYSRGGVISQFQIDGVSASTYSLNQFSPLTLADMALYDRIEVVRGAAGLMTGAGVPSGVASLVRKKPTREFQASVQGSVGRWDDYRGEADISGPLTQDGRIRGRFVAAKQNHNSFTNGYGKGKDALYGLLEADLTDTTLLRFGIDYQKNRQDGAGGVPLFYTDGTQTRFPRSTALSAPWAHGEDETYNYTLNLEQKLSHGWQLKLATNYMDGKGSDLYGALNNTLDQAIDKATNRARFVTTANFGKEQTQKGIDVNLQGPFTLLGRQHEAMFGLSYAGYENIYTGFGETLYRDYGLDDLVNLTPRIPDASVDIITNHTIRQRGFYAATRLNPMDKLHAILGARVSDYTFNGHTVMPAFNYNGTEKYEKKGAVTPYAGIVYDLTGQQSVYASYTDIFTPNNVVDANLKVLDPVVGSNYELGWKGEFYEGRLNANAAVYQIKRDNVAEYVGRNGGTSIYRAIKGVKTQGIDLELAGEIRPGWNLSASYSHSSSKNAAGVRQLTEIPMNTFKLFTTYQLPGAWSKLTLGGGMNWNAKTYAYSSYLKATAQQEAHAVFNLMARYKFNQHLSASLNVSNLFDKTYYAAIKTYGYGYYGEPRNVRVNVRYDF